MLNIYVGDVKAVITAHQSGETVTVVSLASADGTLTALITLTGPGPQVIEGMTATIKFNFPDGDPDVRGELIDEFEARGVEVVRLDEDGES